ncbi:hypothetical protein GGS24DRAFT_504795 [Hypoxylon argillaceum]|nr:hypothetical protein GGS24DRAFT_504795 [Hypoxylon argillaceum]
MVYTTGMKGTTVISLVSSDSGSESDSPLDPTAHKLRSQLASRIDAIETRGEFATKKQYSEFANPGLQIGDALIALPLDPAQVTLIRDASRQAPFGRGEKTLVDTSVRDTWELDASKFRIANPAWAAFVSSTLRHVATTLGMSGVKTELYKLLLYEKGSFFKRHKDSEKAPGMIATLSICLPSRYKGGKVHVSHAGKKRVFDTSQSLFDISALGWYADVTHEIKPIEEGHRLVLIYNIIQTGDGAASAGFFMKQHQKLETAIAKLNLHSPTPKRLLYFLEHKYSETSLRLDHLKGRDRAVGQTLLETCTSNGWYMFLCNVTKTHSDGDGGYGEYDAYGNPYENEDKGPELVMDIVATCSADIFAYEVELDQKDILGPDPYSRRDADSESEDEFTGNEGATVEYRYHDSAAVIVPKGKLDQFFQFGIETKVLFDLVVDDLKANPEDPATLRIVAEFMSKAMVKEPIMSVLVLPLAWRMKNDTLFRAAVRAGFKNGAPETGIINTLVEIISNAQVELVDWEKSLGEFVSSHRSLTTLSKSLDLVKSLLNPGVLQTSFQEWRSTMELSNFERRQALTIDDYDSIMGLAALQWGKEDWVRHTLVPKIRDCSDTKLLSKFICSLLQKGREGVLNKAEEIAGLLLDSGLQKLHLGRVKLNSLPGSCDDRSECNRFRLLLNECLLSGLQQSVDELLRRSISTVEAGPGEETGTPRYGPTVPHRPTLAEEMLGSIFENFEKSKVASSEAARDFAIAVLKKAVLMYLSEYPPQPQGYAHKPRGCGKCKHCQELDEFLVSPSQLEREFNKGPRLSAHMQSQLPRELFQCTTRNMTQGKKSECVFKVVKLNREHEEALRSYKFDLRYVIRMLRSLRTEYAKQLLGADAYGEFIMLEHMPHAGDFELNSFVESQAKRKRPAEDELPDAKRLHIQKGIWGT